MDFAPGTAYKYSNSNYILLGYIIEKLSGQSYEQYIREQIFSPLGMTHSYYDSPEKIIPGRVTGYVQTGENTVVNADYLDPGYAYAAGAYIGTYKFKLDQPSTIKIFEKDHKLYLQQSGAPTAWPMHFTKPTEFYMYEVFPNNHVFSFDSSGKVTGFVIHAPNYTSTITRVE